MPVGNSSHMPSKVFIYECHPCLKVDCSAYLDIGPGLVGDFHDELTSLAIGLAHQMVEDVQVHGGPQIVDIGHEDVLLALGDELVKQA